jgi:hypothetical protein
MGDTLNLIRRLAGLPEVTQLIEGREDVRRLQKSLGMPIAQQDGIMGPITQRYIDNNPNLSQNIKNMGSQSIPDIQAPQAIPSDSDSLSSTLEPSISPYGAPLDPNSDIAKGFKQASNAKKDDDRFQADMDARMKDAWFNKPDAKDQWFNKPDAADFVSRQVDQALAKAAADREQRNADDNGLKQAHSDVFRGIAGKNITTMPLDVPQPTEKDIPGTAPSVSVPMPLDVPQPTEKDIPASSISALPATISNRTNASTPSTNMTGTSTPRSRTSTPSTNMTGTSTPTLQLNQGMPSTDPRFNKEAAESTGDLARMRTLAGLK